MRVTKHVYPFEPCFFAAGTAGFVGECSRAACRQSAEFVCVQRVGHRKRVVALCSHHSDTLTGNVVRHPERLSDKVPDGTDTTD
jgi:hypothetical protein